MRTPEPRRAPADASTRPIARARPREWLAKLCGGHPRHLLELPENCVPRPGERFGKRYRHVLETTFAVGRNPHALDVTSDRHQHLPDRGDPHAAAPRTNRDLMACGR